MSEDLPAPGVVSCDPDITGMIYGDFKLVVCDSPSFALRGIKGAVYEDRPIPGREGADCLSDFASVVRDA